MAVAEAVPLSEIVEGLGSRGVEEVQRGAWPPCKRLACALCVFRTRARGLTQLALPLGRPAIACLRRRLRGGAAQTTVELVRLSPALAELLRAWETLHGAQAAEACAPLLAALAEALAVQPASPEEATAVTHLALDGLARTVRARGMERSQRSHASPCAAAGPQPAAAVRPPVQRQPGP